MGADLPAGWRLATVDEIKADSPSAVAIGPFGSRMKADCYVPFGVPVIRGNNLSDTKSLTGELVFITEEKADELRSSNCYPGDLVFPHRGLIGMVGVVTGPPGIRYMLSTSLMKLTPDPDIADPLYLFYFFRSPVGRHELMKNASQVRTPGIATPLASLRSVRVVLPPIAEQRQIARLLCALDDKIEPNRRMNQTLEAIARAIFKSWFVDFDPVRAKMNGREPKVMNAETAALFPNSPEPSALEDVPAEWAIGSMRDLVTLSRESIHPSDSPDEVFDHYSIPAFDGGRVPAAERGLDIRSNKFVIGSEVVLLSKLNPRFPRVWLPFPAPDRRSIASTEFLVAMPRPGFSREYVYSLFCSDEFMERLSGLVTGTSGSHQRVKPEDFLDMPVVLPHPRVADVFEAVTRPLFKMIAANIRESESLSTIRDTVLPKLISGEIRLPESGVA